MTRAELIEAAGLVGVIVAALVLTPGDLNSDASADLRQACGEMAADAGALIQGARLGAPLTNCFRLAYAAGAGLESLSRVRLLIQQQAPTGASAQAVAQAALVMALAGEAKAIADTALTSREQTTSLGARMDAAFDAAEEFSAAGGDPSSYRAIIRLRAAVARDLAQRGVNLPSLVNYDFGSRRPALWVANRLYGDAGRSDEVGTENRVVHPLFCPAALTALTA